LRNPLFYRMGKVVFTIKISIHIGEQYQKYKTPASSPTRYSLFKPLNHSYDRVQCVLKMWCSTIAPVWGFQKRLTPVQQSSHALVDSASTPLDVSSSSLKNALLAAQSRSLLGQLGTLRGQNICTRQRSSPYEIPSGGGKL
jgi:hypothetical protein